MSKIQIKEWNSGSSLVLSGMNLTTIRSIMDLILEEVVEYTDEPWDYDDLLPEIMEEFRDICARSLDYFIPIYQSFLNDKFRETFKDIKRIRTTKFLSISLDVSIDDELDNDIDFKISCDPQFISTACRSILNDGKIMDFIVKNSGVSKKDQSNIPAYVRTCATDNSQIMADFLFMPILKYVESISTEKEISNLFISLTDIIRDKTRKYLKN